jgi:hypothetical protein
MTPAKTSRRIHCHHSKAKKPLIPAHMLDSVSSVFAASAANIISEFIIETLLFFGKNLCTVPAQGNAQGNFLHAAKRGN